MDKLVTVKTFTFSHQAYLVKSLLDSANIESTIVSRGISNVLQSSEPSVYDLIVHEDNLDMTVEIIDKYEKESI